MYITSILTAAAPGAECLSTTTSAYPAITVTESKNNNLITYY